MKMALMWESDISSDQNPWLGKALRLIRQSTCYVLCLFSVLPSMVMAAEYLSQDQFLSAVFKGQSPQPKVIWLRGELRQSVEQILGHRYGGLRIRYWQSGDDDARTAWVLEEIGKELPITAGFVVSKGVMESVQILAFRESRGGEVRYPSFTRQFQAVTLTADHYLDNHIDGISGATLSVHAITRLSRLALFLHQQVMVQ